MPKKTWILIIAALLLILAAVCLLNFLLPPAPASAPDRVTAPTAKERDAELNDYQNAPVYDPPLKGSALPDTVVNEVPLPGYRDWDQGNCNNCWAWAGTAAVAQSYTVFSGKEVPLSVQFFNSNLNDGNIGKTVPHDWACTIYNPSTFTEAYNRGFNQSYPGDPFVVPWSNANASFRDGTVFAGSQYYNTTNLQKSLINITPNIRFRSMTLMRAIGTNTTNRQEVIRTMSAVLAERRVIIYAVYWPDYDNLAKFADFWDNQSSDALYDPSYMDGLVWNYSDANRGDAHAMVITGYNKTDPDPSRWYWIVQNSLGTTSNRTTGQWKLTMDMNYHARYSNPRMSSGGGPIQQFWMIDVDWKTDPMTTGITPTRSLPTR